MLFASMSFRTFISVMGSAAGTHARSLMRLAKMAAFGSFMALAFKSNFVGTRLNWPVDKHLPSFLYRRPALCADTQ